MEKIICSYCGKLLLKTDWFLIEDDATICEDCFDVRAFYVEFTAH